MAGCLKDCSTFPSKAVLLIIFAALLHLSGEASASGEWPSGVGDNNAETYVLAVINVTYVSDGSRNVTVTERAEIAKYGEGTVGPAAGLLVSVVTASSGEPTSCGLPLVPRYGGGVFPSEPWVALIRRGRCNFDLKVENAFKSNASAVVVYNDRDSPALEKMKLETRNISAVFTTKEKGEKWDELMSGRNKVFISISVGRTGTVTFNNLNKRDSYTGFPSFSLCDPVMPTGHCIHLTSVLFVSISFIVLMVISLAWLVFYYVQRFRYIHAKDRLSKRLSSAAKKALSKIPTKSIKSGDKELQDVECCAVCIEPYKMSDVLRILPCRHEFHKTCIDPWLLEHHTCPMCKMDILKHYGFVEVCRTQEAHSNSIYFTGSQESILHMDIEEVVGLDNSDAMQRRNLDTQSPQVAQHQISGGVSSAREGRNSRSTTPNEMTPSLCVDQCYQPSTSLGMIPTPEPSKRSAKIAPDTPSPSEATPPPSANCDSGDRFDRTSDCQLQDYELESCDSVDSSLTHHSSNSLREGKTC